MRVVAKYIYSFLVYAKASQKNSFLLVYLENGVGFGA